MKKDKIIKLLPLFFAILTFTFTFLINVNISYMGDDYYYLTFTDERL